MRSNKDARVTARLHESTKHKLKKTGYNASEAIEWFVNEYYSNNPRRRLEIMQDLEEIELNKLKKIECEIQLEIEHKEKKINELVLEKSSYPEVKDEDIFSEEGLDVDDEDIWSDEELQAIEKVRDVWEDKKDLMVGAYDDVVEVFDSFIVINGDFIEDVRKKHCKKKNFKDFKDMLLKEVVDA